MVRHVEESKCPNKDFGQSCFLVGYMFHAQGGGGDSGFQVTGMIEGGQKSKPKKIPRASKEPKKIPGPKIKPPN